MRRGFASLIRLDLSAAALPPCLSVLVLQLTVYPERYAGHALLENLDGVSAESCDPAEVELGCSLDARFKALNSGNAPLCRL